MHHDDSARNHARAATLAFAPAVLLASLAAHPFIAGRLPNEAAIAQQVAADTTMWAVVHLAAAVASALMVLAFLALRGYLREAGENSRSAAGVPLVVLGSTLFAVLPGMEFAPLAAAGTGATEAEIAATQSAIVGWFMIVLVAGAILFAGGVLLFATAIASARILSVGTTRVVVAALVVMALARFVPLSVAQFYVHGVAATLALWPVAYHIWTRPAPRTHPGAVLGAA